MTVRASSLGLGLLIGFVPGVAGQSISSTPRDAGRCSTDEHRALDGRLGTWYQENPAGRLLGETHWERLLGGCALWQDWHGASGGEGSSLNAFDAGAGVWRHMWVNGVAVVLLAEGRRQSDEEMAWRVSHISVPREEGEVERWIWSLDPPIFNRVETSKDRGATWDLVFDDRFHPWDGSLPPNLRPRAPCSIDPEHHALAFWTGAWHLRTPDGERVGDSRVDLTTRGCAMREAGSTPALGRYVRLMAYDGPAGAWRMLMVTDRGAVYTAEGTRESDTLRWIVTSAPSGEARDAALSWVLTDRGEDVVHWRTETSPDGGATWHTVDRRVYDRR